MLERFEERGEDVGQPSGRVGAHAARTLCTLGRQQEGAIERVTVRGPACGLPAK